MLAIFFKDISSNIPKRDPHLTWQIDKINLLSERSEFVGFNQHLRTLKTIPYLTNLEEGLHFRLHWCEGNADLSKSPKWKTKTVRVGDSITDETFRMIGNNIQIINKLYSQHKLMLETPDSSKRDSTGAFDFEQMYVEERCKNDLLRNQLSDIEFELTTITENVKKLRGMFEQDVKTDLLRQSKIINIEFELGVGDFTEDGEGVYTVKKITHSRNWNMADFKNVSMGIKRSNELFKGQNPYIELEWRQDKGYRVYLSYFDLPIPGSTKNPWWHIAIEIGTTFNKSEHDHIQGLIKRINIDYKALEPELKKL